MTRQVIRRVTQREIGRMVQSLQGIAVLLLGWTLLERPGLAEPGDVRDGADRLLLPPQELLQPAIDPTTLQVRSSDLPTSPSIVSSTESFNVIDSNLIDNLADPLPDASPDEPSSRSPLSRHDRSNSAHFLENAYRNASVNELADSSQTDAESSLNSDSNSHQNADPETGSDAIDLDPALIQDSPVLQRWLETVPDVRADIRRDPSFRTRLRLGYSQFPANQQAAGWNAGIEDLFLGRTGLTVSGNYQGSFNGDRQAYGGDLHYYVLPLGSSFNVAPVLGYRNLQTDRYDTDGLHVGFRIRWVPSRTGAADITLTQGWVAPGSSDEVGISTLSLGYAVTDQLRISTDLEKQNAPAQKESRVAIVLEWMLPSARLDRSDRSSRLDRSDRLDRSAQPPTTPIPEPETGQGEN